MFILLLFYTRWAVRLAVWGSVPLVLLVEWQFFVASSMLAQSNLGFVLRALVCVLVTLGALCCLLVSRIPPLRRRCSKWVLYLLFSATYALIFLHGALLMEEILKNVYYPWAEHPFGVSLATSGLVLFFFLLLWMHGVYALASRLDASQRRLRRRGAAATEKP